MRTYYYLQKEDIGTVYFKCKDRTGHTFTPSLSEAMRFDSRNKAIDYNHKWLYGDCEVVETPMPFHISDDMIERAKEDLKAK